MFLNRMSIKAKVTLWYVLFLLLMMIVVFSFILAVNDRLITTNHQNQLRLAVQKVYDEIEWDDGELEFDDDIRFNQGNIIISIYNVQGDLLIGYTPKSFDKKIPFIDNQMIHLQLTDGSYYLHDQFATFGNRDIIIRGFIVNHYVDNTTQALTLFVLGFLPFIILVATIGGYSIAKKSFNPIIKIIKSVEEIEDGNNLSKRIGLEGKHDEIHKLSNAFDRLLNRLEIAFKKEKQFSLDASHELKTPTAVILNQTEFALENISNPEEVKQSFEVIQRQATKMNEIISQLLLLSRLEKLDIRERFETINLSEIVEIVIDEQLLIAQEKSINIDFICNEEIKMLGDQTLMIRLFINLIDNAIKFSPENTTITVILYQTKKDVSIQVKDEGKGIAKEHIQHIFDRLYQVDSARTPTYSNSTGIGLSMVKMIAELHRGTIEVMSEVDNGTVFHIKFNK